MIINDSLHRQFNLLAYQERTSDLCRDLKTVIIEYVDLYTINELEHIPEWDAALLFNRYRLNDELNTRCKNWRKEYLPHTDLDIVNPNKFVIENINISRLYNLRELFIPKRLDNIPDMDELTELLLSYCYKIGEIKGFHNVDGGCDTSVEGTFYFGSNNDQYKWSPYNDMLKEYHIDEKDLFDKLSIVSMYESCDRDYYFRPRDTMWKYRWEFTLR
jgi:hypothetical protein